jgi:hypothetical protein
MGLKGGSVAFLALTLAAGAAKGQEPEAPAAPTANAERYVTREEYDKLRKDIEALKAGKGGGNAKTDADKESSLADEFDAEIRGVKSRIEGIAPGSTKLLLTGNGFLGYTLPKTGTSSFNAFFELLPLVKLGDEWFFEGNIGVTVVGQGAAQFDTGFAHLVWVPSDYFMIGAGLFPNPANKYHEVLDPAWLNRLPSDPLPLNGILMADRELGIDVRGAAPVGPMRVHYAAFVSNGQALNTGDPATSPNTGPAGTLNIPNWTDNNDNKGVGGHIGILPLPDSSVEVGYGIEWNEVGQAGTAFKHAEAFVQSVDFDYGRDYKVLAGRIDIRAQWIWSQVSTETYDPDGSLGFGPLRFPNNRNGGYAQLSYRPSLSKIPVLEKMEFIGRYAQLNQPRASAPVGTGFNETTWDLGVDYWFAPSIVAKVAYEWDDKDGIVPAGTPRHADAFMAQVALGF